MLRGGGHLKAQGQGQRQSDLISRLSRKLKQRTIKSYINLKFKMADWDLQWTIRGH